MEVSVPAQLCTETLTPEVLVLGGGLCGKGSRVESSTVRLVFLLFLFIHLAALGSVTPQRGWGRGFPLWVQRLPESYGVQAYLLLRSVGSSFLTKD